MRPHGAGGEPLECRMDKQPDQEELKQRLREATERENQPHREPTGKIRVLLAEDHIVVRQAITSRLREEPDIEVVELAASTGELALEIAKRVLPDVIVMDVKMAGIGGIEATRQIKAILPQVKIIGLSMNPPDLSGRIMIEAGASAYLTKDISVEELLATIRRVV